MSYRIASFLAPIIVTTLLFSGCGRYSPSASRAVPAAITVTSMTSHRNSHDPGQWPMYGLDAAHNAVFGSTGSGRGAGWMLALPGAIPAGTPTVLIKKNYVNITSVRDLVGVPVGVSVVDGTVYVPDDNGHLYAVDATTGRILWHFNARNQIMTTPLVAGHGDRRLVYIGGGNSTFSYSQAVRFGLRNTSVVRGTDISGIYALNAATGKLVWSYPTRGEDMPTPVYYEGHIIFGNGDGHVYALDAQTGRLVWKSGIRSFVSMSSATRYRNLIIMAATHPNGLYAVDARTGRRAWSTYPARVSSSSMGDCAPAVSGNIVATQFEMAAGRGRAASVEMAFDARNGRILWRRVLGTGLVPPRNKDAVPVISGGVLYTGSPVTENAYALNLQNGRVLWHARINVKMKAAPTIVGPYAFFPAANGSIFVLNRETGNIWRMYKTGHGGFGVQNAVVVNHSLIIGSNFGWLYSIPLSQLTTGIAVGPPHY
ncbi:MAG: outer membrane protein assembly factor BamB family protein [Acidiferrobacteraceae bacterium]